jgi:hypothetical protein
MNYRPFTFYLFAFAMALFMPWLTSANANAADVITSLPAMLSLDDLDHSDNTRPNLPASFSEDVGLFDEHAPLQMPASGPEFQELQSIPTNGAIDWEYFTIGSEHYLAVTNHYNGSIRNIDSKLYRWDGASFVEFQSIPTSSAYDWEYFTIGSEHYLAVANYRNDSTHNIDWKM